MTYSEEQKQWGIKEAKWKSEQDARVQLMREVYESRATHIEHKKRLYTDTKDSVKRDMDDLQKDLSVQGKMAEEKQVAQQLNR